MSTSKRAPICASSFLRHFCWTLGVCFVALNLPPITSHLRPALLTAGVWPTDVWPLGCDAGLAPGDDAIILDALDLTPRSSSG